MTLGLICLICEPIFAQINAQLKLDFEKIILSKHSFPFNGVEIVSKMVKRFMKKYIFGIILVENLYLNSNKTNKI